MYCSNNDARCFNQGYCECHHEVSQAAGGCGGLAFSMIIGIPVSFLYPAIRIARSNIEYDENQSPKFTGTLWLFLSPLFGFLSNTLYQIVFSFGAWTAGVLQNKVTGSIYIIGMYSIYALAIGLAVVAFLFKNRTAIKLFTTVPEARNAAKTAVLAGLVLMVLLAVIAGVVAIVIAADGYFIKQSNIQYSDQKEKQRRMKKNDN